MKRRAVLAGLTPLIGLNPPAGVSARELGAARRPLGERSPHETATRFFRTTSPTPASGVSVTPLQDTLGTITPSALHFERHHSGVPELDAARHTLLIHGLVHRPLVFSVDELRRLPSVSKLHFIECGGNSAMEHAGHPGKSAQWSHGLVSCSEWTGVALKLLLAEAGLQDGARWLVAEGADAALHTRSLPLEKALDDALVAYGQNGEALRPEQGYPIRLLVPGWEGNVSVKWLRSLQLAASPAMSRDESVSYTDLLPDGRARQFSFEMDVKSVILRPSGGQKLTQPGFHEISGIAWSGRGYVTGVDVSVDGGVHWRAATLGQPVWPKAFTRFTLPWQWRGGDAWILSRATDSSGAEQPYRKQLVEARGLVPGPDGFNHYNGIKAWHVLGSGEVVHV